MLKNLWSKPSSSEAGPKRLWLDLGDLGDLVNPAGPHEQWQDHGLGLLRTILHQNGVMTALASTRACTVAIQDWKSARLIGTGQRLEGLLLQHAHLLLRLGTAAGAANTQTLGTGLVEKSLVIALVEKVQVKPYD